MRHAEIEKFCLSLKAVTLVVQWGDARVYKVGGKVFAVLSAASEKPQRLTFKVSEDSFHILTQDLAIIQAPYFAKTKWVNLERLDALSAKELKAYLSRAHALIAAGLPKKTRIELKLEPSLSSPAERAKRSKGKGTQVRKAR